MSWLVEFQETECVQYKTEHLSPSLMNKLLDVQVHVNQQLWWCAEKPRGSTKCCVFFFSKNQKRLDCIVLLLFNNNNYTHSTNWNNHAVSIHAIFLPAQIRQVNSLNCKTNYAGGFILRTRRCWQLWVFKTGRVARKAKKRLANTNTFPHENKPFALFSDGLEAFQFLMPGIHSA